MKPMSIETQRELVAQLEIMTLLFRMALSSNPPSVQESGKAACQDALGLVAKARAEMGGDDG